MGFKAVVCVDFDDDVVDVDVGFDDETVDTGVDFDEVVDVGFDEDVVDVDFDDGVDVGFDDAVDVGFDDAVDVGFDDAVDAGFDDAVDVGVDDAVDVGIDDSVDVGVDDCAADVSGEVVDDIGFESKVSDIFGIPYDDSLWVSDDETADIFSSNETGSLFPISEQPLNSDAQTTRDIIDLNALLLIKFTPYYTLYCILFYNYISFQSRCQAEKNVTRKSFQNKKLKSPRFSEGRLSL